jgi:hypothetical protein
MEREKKNSKNSQKSPLLFVYFKGTSVTEEGFLAILSKKTHTVHNSSFLCWHHVPLPPLSGPLSLGQKEDRVFWKVEPLHSQQSQV